MSHTIYAVKFQQTIIHQHVHLRRENQSHAPAHVPMKLYRINQSLAWLQSERRTICLKYHYVSFFSEISTVFSNLRLLTHWNDNKNNKKYRKNIAYDVGPALTKNCCVNVLLTIPYWYLDLQRSNRTEAKLLQLQILHTCIHKYGVLPIVRRPISPTAH